MTVPSLSIRSARFVFLAAALLAWSPPSRAACTSRVSEPLLVDLLGRAENAYAALDAEAFSAAARAAREALPCVDAVLSPDVVGTVHRVEGLDAWLGRRSERAVAAFAAAHAADPQYRFPDRILPLEAPERAAYEAVSPTAAGSTALASPPVGTLRVDGEVAALRPTDRPVVIQVVGSDGRARWTAYAWPEDPVLPPTPEVKKKSPAPWVAGGASAAVLVAGVVVYGTGLGAAGTEEYEALTKDDPATARDFYYAELQPRFITGGVLAALGGAALVTSGVWVAVTSSGPAAGLRLRW